MPSPVAVFYAFNSNKNQKICKANKTQPKVPIAFNNSTKYAKSEGKEHISCNKKKNKERTKSNKI